MLDYILGRRIRHIAIDSTGLKVFGEGEWKVKKHGSEKRRTWRKLHMAVDVDTHEIISAEMTLVNVGDSDVLPSLFNPLTDLINKAVSSIRTAPMPQRLLKLAEVRW